MGFLRAGLGMTSARISRPGSGGWSNRLAMTSFSTKLPSGKTLAAVMGSATAAAALTGSLMTWEGKENVGYLDLAKIPTACFGDTNDVVVGKFYTDGECKARLERQAIVHVEGVLACVPTLRGKDAFLHAAGSMAYNIGVRNFCTSTAAARFKSGSWLWGCEAIGPYFIVTRKDGSKVAKSGFINVSKKPVQGLINRRTYEMHICLQGLAA